MFFFIGNPRTRERVKQTEQSRCMIFFQPSAHFVTPRAFQVQA
jgi:hypothetical protein